MQLKKAGQDKKCALMTTMTSDPNFDHAKKRKILMLVILGQIFILNNIIKHCLMPDEHT